MINPLRGPQTIPSLNGLRAISVLLVMSAHSGFGTIVPGALGVTVFFFLSGYLITTLMIEETERFGKIDILSFYTRRVFRLAPTLLVTLTIAYGLTYLGLLGGRITLEGFAAQLLYFANYYALFFDHSAQTTPAGTGILWSLAVEEHFYIVFPLLMTVFASVASRPRTIVILLAVTCLVILAWRIYLVQSPAFFSDRTYLASETRIDSIIYGCLMAFLINPLRTPNRAKTMSLFQWTFFSIGIGSLLFSLVYRNPVFRETFRYSLQGIALFPLFYFAIRFPENALFRHLNSAWAVRIGTYSYAIYLIHQIVIFALDKNVPFIRHYPFFILPITLLISFAYAAAIGRFVDQYFNRLRHKYRPAKRPPSSHGSDIRKPLAEGAVTKQNCAA